MKAARPRTEERIASEILRLRAELHEVATRDLVFSHVAALERHKERLAAQQQAELLRLAEVTARAADNAARLAFLARVERFARKHRLPKRVAEQCLIRIDNATIERT